MRQILFFSVLLFGTSLLTINASGKGTVSSPPKHKFDLKNIEKKSTVIHMPPRWGLIVVLSLISTHMSPRWG